MITIALFLTAATVPERSEPECGVLNHLVERLAPEYAADGAFVRDYARYNRSLEDHLAEWGQVYDPPYFEMTQEALADLYDPRWEAAFTDLPYSMAVRFHEALVAPEDNRCEAPETPALEWISRAEMQRRDRDRFWERLRSQTTPPRPENAETDPGTEPTYTARPRYLEISQPAFNAFHTRALVRVGYDRGPEPVQGSMTSHRGATIKSLSCFGSYLLLERVRGQWHIAARLDDGCAYVPTMEHRL